MAAKTATKKKATRKQAAKKQAPAKKAGKKKLSQMAAAEKVLATAKKPMNCKEMVEAMAKKRLWSSPGGKTPDATLYAAILREINAKGKEAGGKVFAANSPPRFFGDGPANCRVSTPSG